MGKILVVEDDESMNEVLVRTLLDLGYDVHSAFNVPSAVTLCVTIPFTLVITDVMLPGKDGVEGLALIKASQKDIKCIVITGYASAETPARAIRLKVDDYLLKPFSFRSFLASVNQVLDSKQNKQKREVLLRAILPDPDRPLSAIEKSVTAERRDALRGLYVGIRSDFLSRPAAREAYSRLEGLEIPFRKLIMSATLEKERLSKLQREYAAISDRIASFHLGNAEKTLEVEHQVPQDMFATLFEGLKTSRIGFHDLDYAPLLKVVPNERLRRFEELLTLKKLLWPGLM